MSQAERQDLWAPSITLEEAYQIQTLLEERHEEAKQRKDFNAMALLRGEMDRIAREHGL